MRDDEPGKVVACDLGSTNTSLLIADCKGKLGEDGLILERHKDGSDFRRVQDTDATSFKTLIAYHKEDVERFCIGTKAEKVSSKSYVRFDHFKHLLDAGAENQDHCKRLKKRLEKHDISLEKLFRDYYKALYDAIPSQQLAEMKVYALLCTYPATISQGAHNLLRKAIRQAIGDRLQHPHCFRMISEPVAALSGHAVYNNDDRILNGKMTLNFDVGGYSVVRTLRRINTDYPADRSA